MLCPYQYLKTNLNITELENLHSKQLLKMLRSIHKGCSDSVSDDAVCKECFSNIIYDRSVLKSILSTREHILTKQESKEKRKALIRKGK